MALATEKKVPLCFTQPNYSGRMTYQEWPNHGRWLIENGQIMEDDFLGPGHFRLMTSQNWPAPGKSSSVARESQLAKSEKRIWWNQLPKVICRGQAISACHKLELRAFFKMTSRWLEMTEKVTLVEQSHLRNPEAALNDWMLLSRDCITRREIFNLPLPGRASSSLQRIEWAQSRPQVKMVKQEK